jgi:chemotaxis protein methyltransferase CheR
MSGATVAGAFTLRPEDFNRIARIAYDEAGICLPDSKATLVYARLVKRLRRLKLRDFSDYCALVTSEGGSDERRNMIAALTTNLTRFFRETHHFDHLRRSVLPVARGRVRLWSAACSSGEEAVSIALCVLADQPDAATRDLRILATDIDPNMLEAARAGVFSAASVEHVPKSLRGPAHRPWFIPETAGFVRVAPEVLALIDFRPLNLIADWPMRGPFQAIFCRNVAIYFDQPTQEKLWLRLADMLAADGVLYIGHSERVTGPAYARLRADGVTTYRRCGAAAQAPRSEARAR